MGAKIRIAKWDNIKFILILCVVMGHFFDRYTSDSLNARRIVFFIYSFHMPAFIFISGLFAKKTINTKNYHKIFSFFILFVFTKFSLFFINFIKNYHAKGIVSSFSFFDMNDVSWYAFAVFIFYIITIFFRRYSPVYVMVLSVFSACVIGYAKDVDTYLSISRIFTFYPYFLIGYYLNIEKLAAFVKKKWVIAAGWGCFIATALVSYLKANDFYWYINIFKGKYGYSHINTHELHGFGLRLLWYAVSFVLIIALVAVIPSIQCIFTTWGGRTMQVYALHYIPMLAFFNILNGKDIINSISASHHMPVLFFITFAVTCVLSIKPIEKIMNIIIYPKIANNDNITSTR